MVKDEADIITGTIAQLLDEGVDTVWVLDNNSTDGTSDLLADVAREHQGRIIVEHDPEVAYYQSDKITALAARAAGAGAEWVIPFDADELWFCHGDHLAVELCHLGELVGSVEVAIVNHFPSAIDPEDGHPFDTIVYRQPQPQPLGKTAFRWEDGAVVGQGNHHVILPSGKRHLGLTGMFELRHFPYRTYEQFRRKAINGRAAYQATALPHDTGAHWREFGAILERGGDEALREVFETWFHFKAPITQGLICDPAPHLRWKRR